MNPFEQDQLKRLGFSSLASDGEYPRGYVFIYHDGDNPPMRVLAEVSHAQWLQDLGEPPNPTSPMNDPAIHFYRLVVAD